MIRFVQDKKIDNEKFFKHLEQSEKHNHFANNGPAKIRLEEYLHSFMNLPKDKCVVCTANGTLALHALFLFYAKRGVKKRVSPSFTFPSCTVGGFDTEILDISLANYSFDNIDKVAKENDCIVVTNLFGTYPHDLKKMIDVCRQNKTKIILDNASSPMTSVSGANICSLGDAAFGSLHHTKFLGFGEGGFLVVDKEHKEEINSIICFGFSTDKSKNRVCEALSSNFKMSDVSAAAVLQHIENYDLSNHIANQNLLLKNISEISGVEVFNNLPGVVYGNLPVVFDKPVSAKSFVQHGVEAQKYYYPIKEYENSSFLYDRIINLPLHSFLTKGEIDVMCDAIEAITNE